jgi:hypothetical protein
MKFWAKIVRFLTAAPDTDIDEDGKEFPTWHMKAGEHCLDKDCVPCAVADYNRGVSRCSNAAYRSRIRHYAKYKVNRRFFA